MLKPYVLAPRLMFFASRSGKDTRVYYMDSTALPVRHNWRIAHHKVFENWRRGKTSTG